jgi:hypothetical protein
LPIVAIVMLVGLLVGGVVFAAAVLVPLVPLLILGFFAWVVWRLMQGPAKAGYYLRS